MSEVWKPIKGYEGFYEVSSFGRVKSLASAWRNQNSSGFYLTNKILKIARDKGGYQVVGITKNKKYKMAKVHRLAAEAFISNHENKPCVNHKDGIKANNFVENLEWCTYKENTKHAIDSGLITYYSRFKKVKQLTKDGDLIKVWSSMSEAKKKTRASNIGSCCKGRLNHSGGFRWEYA